jgi:hypothetical protein
LKNSVLSALTDDGESLPIIDITNPTFAVKTTEADLAAMADQFLIESAQQRDLTPALREALQHSTIGRGLMAAAGSFLDGMSTYRIKLGPDNLWAGASPIDRSIAASFPAFTSRLRLQDMAQLLAEGLSAIVAAQPSRSVLLINIAGGAGSDSWNALIHLRAQQPSHLSGREIVIAVLDADSSGPRFGSRAVDTLRAEDAPLHGLDIRFSPHKYDWSNVEELQATLRLLNAGDAACSISSEGGLFEYGSDAEIRSNLEVLHARTASDARIVGSVTREGGPMQASQSASRIRTHPRTLEQFTSLAESAGWKLQRAIERPFSFHISLAKL